MAETNWIALLESEDVEGLWNALFHLVSRHPSVRPLKFVTDETAVTSEFEVNADLAQELFLELFQKRRFDYYLNNGYTSGEIENEITRIELPNLVGARLRKRYPESFRMARRVSALLKSSGRFRQFDALEKSRRVRRAKKSGTNNGGKARAAAARASAAVRSNYLASTAPFKYNRVGLFASEAGNETQSWDQAVGAEPNAIDDLSLAGEPEDTESNSPERKRRMVNQFYGLKEWSLRKPHADPGLFRDLVRSSVPVRGRDTRVVGRSATSQLILSNTELEKLIVNIFEAIDSPADVKTIRQLTLSRIPLQDYNIAALDSTIRGDGNQSSPNSTYLEGTRDERMTPEQELIDEERRSTVVRMAQEFLERLFRVVNSNHQRYDRIVKTLWYCYFDQKQPSQLEIARLLGVSDSLVSDNRKIIEFELKKLALSLEDASLFSDALSDLVSTRVRPDKVVAMGARGSVRSLFR